MANTNGTNGVNGKIKPEHIIITEDYIIRNIDKPPPIPECSVAETYHKIMNQWAQEGLLGLIDGETGEQKTFEEWLNESKRFTSGLIKIGLNKDDLVLMFGENSLQYAITMMGVVFMGLTFSPVTPANGQFELTHQINSSQGSVLIIDRQKLPILKQALQNEEYQKIIMNNIKLFIVMNCVDNDPILEDLVKIIKAISSKVVVHTYEEIIAKGEGVDTSKMNIPHYPVAPEDYFIIVYTSGTTGSPKGSIHSNASTQFSLGNFQPKFLKKGTQFTMWYPFGHMSGTFFMLICFRAGITVTLFNSSDLDKLLGYVSKHKLMLLTASPDNVTKLAQEDYTTKYELSSLKYIWSGGTKIPPSQMKIIQDRYKLTFIEGYGATEFMGPVRSGETNQELGNVGRPLCCCEMRIIDLETGKNLPPNQTGEICFRGPARFVKYLGNEEATKKAIDSEGWYHTGDVGYYDETGSLFIVDRIKELMKFRGWSISPSEVEEFVMKNKAIDSVCIVGVKHQSDVNHLRAYIKVKPGYKITEQDIIKEVELNMGFQKRLRGGIRFIEHMPRTAVGKIDRKYFHSLVKDELLTEIVD